MYLALLIVSLSLQTYITVITFFSHYIATHLHKEFLLPENVSLYFKLTITSILHSQNLFKRIYVPANIIFATRKDFVTSIFQPI